MSIKSTAEVSVSSSLTQLCRDPETRLRRETLADYLEIDIVGRILSGPQQLRFLREGAAMVEGTKASTAGSFPPEATATRASVTDIIPEATELAFVKRELTAKEAELAVRERSAALTMQQAQRSAWRDPVILGIIAALIGFLSSVANAFFQARSAAEAERLKFQSNLILEAIKTGDPPARPQTCPSSYNSVISMTQATRFRAS